MLPYEANCTWKATSGNSRRSATRSTAKPTRSNHSYILTASSPMRCRMTSSGGLEIGERATGDARENGEGVTPREFVAREVDALADEATGDRLDLRDGNLPERPCWR